MNCEIAIIDPHKSKVYNHESLVNDSLGACEGSIIRLAEGFASKGHDVIVVQGKDFIPITSPKGVQYVPWGWLNVIRPKIVIHLRNRIYLDKFKYAKQIIWMHDAISNTHNNISDWNDILDAYNIKLVSSSKWHTDNIKEYAPDLDVRAIYSPTDESFSEYPKPESYDKNQLVWMSSPHKGLDKAIELFNELLKVNPEFKLVVFNPGYIKTTKTQHSRIIYLSEASRAQMKSIISRSLCVFYPTEFKETLGMFAVEANALGTPVACMKVAALIESCNNQFATSYEDLLKLVISWHLEGRPIVKFQKQFKFENIYPQWAQLFLEL